MAQIQQFNNDGVIVDNLEAEIHACVIWSARRRHWLFNLNNSIYSNVENKESLHRLGVYVETVYQTVNQNLPGASDIIYDRIKDYIFEHWNEISQNNTINFRLL